MADAAKGATPPAEETGAEILARTGAALADAVDAAVGPWIAESVIARSTVNCSSGVSGRPRRAITDSAIQGPTAASTASASAAPVRARISAP
ncbi:MAG: hypothetical protein AAFN30_19350, partial [Actinomycetota bacterium]